MREKIATFKSANIFFHLYVWNEFNCFTFNGNALFHSLMNFLMKTFDKCNLLSVLRKLRTKFHYHPLILFTRASFQHAFLLPPTRSFIIGTRLSNRVWWEDDARKTRLWNHKKRFHRNISNRNINFITSLHTLYYVSVECQCTKNWTGKNTFSTGWTIL